jgi:hypothetical protein
MMHWAGPTLGYSQDQLADRMKGLCLLLYGRVSGFYENHSILFAAIRISRAPDAIRRPDYAGQSSA